MIVAFGVIGLLILFLIYFVLRAQNLQKERIWIIPCMLF